MHDFVAIGDTVIDAFIRLKNAEITGTPDHADYKICLPFAEKIPYEDVTVIPAVGNAANAAVAAARLGLRSALVSNVGDDQNGRDCLAALLADKVDADFIKVNKGVKTNYHYVLWYPPDRTILIKHEKHDYDMPNVGEPKWLYFSSVAETAYPFHEFVADYLGTHSMTKFAFQPGKNEISLGKDKLARLYKRADIFFCNVEEAEKILGIDTLGIEELLKRIHELGPKVVVITDGPTGAYAYDGEKVTFKDPYPDPKPPLDRTGAGDAFAATTVAAMALGKDLDTAMSWAMINSMSVVQQIGAQKGLLTREEIEGLSS
ncbi:carbohydrate kinase family protein [Candidatus Parcubacteria bacterium]|nr:carbohydrate kinase family protein [Candidatus Parcubacteria bacterium]